MEAGLPFRKRSVLGGVPTSHHHPEPIQSKPKELPVVSGNSAPLHAHSTTGLEICNRFLIGPGKSPKWNSGSTATGFGKRARSAGICFCPWEGRNSETGLDFLTPLIDS
jgi:hypothetical protein